MDRVRFGRALGYGARHAAKAVAKAVDAATAPNPAAAAHSAAPRRTPPVQGASAGSQAAGHSGARSTHNVGERLTQAQAGVRQGKAHAGHLRQHIGTPLAKFSSVVWLQVTGTFFALLAAFLSQGLWKERGAIRMPIHSPGVGTFYLHAAAFAIFVYFAVSSFVRAHLRQRR